MEKQSLTSLLQITHPVIMAPMFLVSNTKMVIEGMKSGIAGCIPALNYRTLEELRASIHELKAAKVPGDVQAPPPQPPEMRPDVTICC